MAAWGQRLINKVLKLQRGPKAIVEEEVGKCSLHFEKSRVIICDLQFFKNQTKGIKNS